MGHFPHLFDAISCAAVTHSESGTILGFQYWGGGLAPNEGMTWKKKKSFNILFVYEGRHDQYTAGSTLPIKLIPEY